MPSMASPPVRRRGTPPYPSYSWRDQSDSLKTNRVAGRSSGSSHLPSELASVLEEWEALEEVRERKEDRRRRARFSGKETPLAGPFEQVAGEPGGRRGGGRAGTADLSPPPFGRATEV